jgi:hypothetical protein
MVFHLSNSCIVLYVLFILKLNEENKDHVGKIWFAWMHNKKSNISNDNTYNKRVAGSVNNLKQVKNDIFSDLWYDCLLINWLAVDALCSSGLFSSVLFFHSKQDNS